MIAGDCIVRQITYLFHNLNEFAAMAAAIYLNCFHPKQFDYDQYPLGVYWFGIKKNQ